jgi:CarboxypepD_reg-like domain/TonB-dependent Receptor Plug Domain
VADSIAAGIELIGALRRLMSCENVRRIILFLTGALISTLFLFLPRLCEAQKKENIVRYIVRGKITEAGSGEPVIGANIYATQLKFGTTSNAVGEYFLHLPEGKNHLQISFIGYEDLVVDFELLADTILRHSMTIKTSTLNEVVVSGEADPVNSLRLGQNTLDLASLKRMPPLLGEPDIIRGLLMMPGVSTVGEGATGYNVRGGSVDQNLILLDDAPVFNTSHLFGFLTAFNSNSVLNANLYKAGIPANYGGRVSSVLDVKLKQGNSDHIAGQAGVGLMAANVTIEGPIIPNRTTILVTGRTSYSDWLLHTVPNITVSSSKASFYDGTVKVSHQINKNNQLSFTGYGSHDSFKFRGDTTYGWGTKNFTLKLGSTLKPNLFLMTSLVSSQYQYKVMSREPTNEFDWKAGINFQNAKADLAINYSKNHKADVGVSVERYDVNLGNLNPASNSNINTFSLDNEKALISYAYYSHQYDVSERISFRAGVRLSNYQLHGPGKVNRYESGVPRSSSSYLETDQYGKGNKIQNYNGFEPRFALRVGVNSNSSIKASLDQTVQYLHLISNTSAVSPIDIWKLSDPYLKPQVGRQVSLGYFRSLSKNKYNFSMEVFYKQVDNIVDYKDGASLLLNDKLEEGLLQGKGRSYGSEWMIEKKQGKFTGWLSYTLSRTERRINGAFPEEKINTGHYYPANYDKPNNIAFTGSYRKNERISWGYNFVYASGRPITYPSSSYSFGGVRVANFEMRNNERTPDYHRLDLSLEIRSKPRPERKWRGTWVVSIYNVYARKNPYSIFFRSEYYVVAQAFRLSVIGTAIPSLSYTINF